MSVVTVRFDAEIRLIDDEAPPMHELSYGNLIQAVQDRIGHTGAIVLDVVEYEETYE